MAEMKNYKVIPRTWQHSMWLIDLFVVLATIQPHHITPRHATPHPPSTFAPNWRIVAWTMTPS